MEDKGLILDGIGICRFCGQALAVKPTPGETPEEAAAEICDCRAARDFRRRRERIARSGEMIRTLFAGENEKFDVRPIPQETAELLQAAAVLAIDGKLSKLIVQIGGICRAEIATGGKGEIKVRRVEGRTLRAEE